MTTHSPNRMRFQALKTLGYVAVAGVGYGDSLGIGAGVTDDILGYAGARDGPGAWEGPSQ